MQELLNKSLQDDKEIAGNLEDFYRMCMHDSACVQEVIARATEILDADYKKVNVSDAADNFTYLSIEKQSRLKSLLYKCEILFNGTLGR